MSVYYFAEYSEKPEVKITSPGLPEVIIKNGYTQDIEGVNEGKILKRLGAVESSVPSTKKQVRKSKGDKPDG